MAKITVTDALLDKAGKALQDKEYIRSGEGLTRTELRVLERAGVLAKEYVHEDRTVFCVWRRIASILR